MGLLFAADKFGNSGLDQAEDLRQVRLLALQRLVQTGCCLEELVENRDCEEKAKVVELLYVFPCCVADRVRLVFGNGLKNSD